MTALDLFRRTAATVPAYQDFLRERGVNPDGVRELADVPLMNSPIPAEHIAWSVASESAALVRGDIGIAPTPEDRWTLGKCGFKIVQYMAAGLPVIASPVGANCELVKDGVTGRLAESAAQWVAAIGELAGDWAKRAAFGAAGRRLAESQYGLQRAVDAWADLLARRAE